MPKSMRIPRIFLALPVALAFLLTACLIQEENGEDLLPPESEVSGTWTGSWSSGNYPELSGSVTVILQADGNNITGTASFTGSDCFPGSMAVTGTISGTRINLDVGNGSIHVDGTVGDSFWLTGGFSVMKPESCEDGGSLNLTKTVGGGSGPDTTPAGAWTGSWTSVEFPETDGSVTLTLEASGAFLSGTAVFMGSDCLSGTQPVSGSFTGASVFLNVGGDLSFAGNYTASSLSGTYSLTGSGDCEDSGTVTLSKTPGTGGGGGGDGGDSVATPSWTEQSSGATGALRALHFTDTVTGYTAGDGGAILKTTNGGLSWSALNSGTTARLNTMFFVNASTGWVAGEGIVLGTTNAGATWSKLLEGTFTVTSIHFPDANTGYAAAGDRLLATTDGGTTWTGTEESASGYFGGSAFQRYLIRGVFYTEASSGHLVGTATENRDGIVPPRGAAHRMPQGSSTVLGREQMGGSGLLSVHFTSQNTGYAVGSWGQIFKTENAGGSWSLLREDGQNLTGRTIRTLTSVHFPRPDTGFVVGMQPHVILYTSNGGTTWTVHDAGTTLNLYAVHCPATSTCYAAGDNGRILKYR